MVAIGVTGHRQLAYLKLVSQAVDSALEKIIRSFNGQSILVISSLAEGTDRLVAERALESYMAKLTVPLPLESDDYQQDFSSEISKQTFRILLQRAESVIKLPLQDTRTASYLSAGMYTLSLCDVLLAIWDGQPARGIGGTGQIVAEARKRGKPLAWIEVRRQETGQAAIRMSELKIHYERFPSNSK